jgi:(p)ppGpp synthase/HD superfamily hydrolase
MLTPWSQDKYITALRFSAEAHAGQTIPGTQQPYVVHTAQVAMEVMGAHDGECGQSRPRCSVCVAP